MNLNRRTFLKGAGVAGAAGLASGPSIAKAALGPRRRADEMRGVLVDTTRCIGCRTCELACSEKNKLPEPAMLGDPAIFEKPRTTTPENFTVVNRYESPPGSGTEIFRKSQCMHCVEPACASACLVKAFEKTPEGPVVYHDDRCIGCRYCMVACPFNVPKFEYSKALPYVRKCTMCIDRVRAGKPPACVDACPGGALQFGSRKELLEEAKTRIYQNPDTYVHHIYGEHEVGGTGFLYISDVPFEQLGMKTDVGEMAYSQLTWPFLSAVPFVLTLWPPFLMGLYAFSKSREEAEQGPSAKKSEVTHE